VADTQADVPVTSYDDALRSDDRRTRLNARALGAVIAIVPADVASIVSITRRRTVGEAIMLCSPRAAIALSEAGGLWARDALDQSPLRPLLAEDLNAGVLMLADVRSQTPRAHLQLLDAIGACDEAAMYLRTSGTIVAVVTLLRSAGGPGFSRADVLALRRVQPLLEHAHACAAEPGGETPGCRLRDYGLTAREADVAALVGKGATNAQIARSLHLSEATVKTHLSHSYAKLGVRTRTELAVLVRDPGGHASRVDRTSVRRLTTFG